MNNKNEVVTLHQAVEAGDYKSVAHGLKDKSCNVNARDEQGNTPLHCYLKSDARKEDSLSNCNDRPRLFELLITSGADVNVENNQGESPLLIFLKKKSRLSVNDGIAQRLLGAGAVLTQKIVRHAVSNWSRTTEFNTKYQKYRQGLKALKGGDIEKAADKFKAALCPQQRVSYGTAYCLLENTQVILAMLAYRQLILLLEKHPDNLIVRIRLEQCHVSGDYYNKLGYKHDALAYLKAASERGSIEAMWALAEYHDVYITSLTHFLMAGRLGLPDPKTASDIYLSLFDKVNDDAERSKIMGRLCYFSYFDNGYIFTKAYELKMANVMRNLIVYSDIARSNFLINEFSAKKLITALYLVLVITNKDFDTLPEALSLEKKQQGSLTLQQRRGRHLWLADFNYRDTVKLENLEDTLVFLLDSDQWERIELLIELFDFSVVAPAIMKLCEKNIAKILDGLFSLPQRVSNPVEETAKAELALLFAKTYSKRITKSDEHDNFLVKLGRLIYSLSSDAKGTKNEVRQACLTKQVNILIKILSGAIAAHSTDNTRIAAYFIGWKDTSDNKADVEALGDLDTSLLNRFTAFYQSKKTPLQQLNDWALEGNNPANSLSFPAQ